MLSGPLTASQISATMKSFEHKMTGLKRRIQKLGPNAPRQNAVYMRFRLARQNAAYLAARLIQETCERVGVAHGLVRV